MNIIEKLQEIKCRPYYYVGPCPHCNSEITGRYIAYRGQREMQWVIDESLRNGEIVYPVAEKMDKNCYCLECGESFNYPVELSLYSIKEVKKEKLKRHTAELLAERMQDDDHKKAKGIFAPFVNFVGKI